MRDSTGETRTNTKVLSARLDDEDDDDDGTLIQTLEKIS